MERRLSQTPQGRPRSGPFLLLAEIEVAPSPAPPGAVEAGHDLRDGAVGEAIVAHEVAVAARPPKLKKKRKLHKWAKTSVIWVMFKAIPLKPGKWECLLSDFFDDDAEHLRVVGQSAAGKQTTNLLNHARHFRQPVLDALTKAHNDRRDVKVEFDALLEAMKVPDGSCKGLLNLGFTRVKRGSASVAGLIANCILFNVLESPHFEAWMTTLQVK